MKTKIIKELMESMKRNDILRLDYKNGLNRLVLEREIVKNHDFLGIESIVESTEEKKSILEGGRVINNNESKLSVNDNLDNVHLIKSPLIGTFYEASEPGATPFVKINDVVKVGDTLCIVEAMKSMNEIKSDVDGKIIEILGKNGKLVEYDAALFKIEI